MSDNSISQLVEYIKSARGKQESDSQIREDIQKIGWTAKDIELAFLNLDKNIPLPPSQATSSVTAKDQTVQNETMWVAFQNILMFISLYAFATALYSLIGSIISYYTSSNSPYDVMYSVYSTVTNYSLAAVIVGFPLFVFFFISTYRYYAQNPEMKQVGSKKTLNYITLVITFLIMLFNIVMLVASVVGGTLESRVFLNMLNTFIVNGSIFAYFLYEAKFEKQSPSAKNIYTGLIALSIIVISISGFGFYLNKRPAQKIPRVANPYTATPYPRSTAYPLREDSMTNEAYTDGTILYEGIPAVEPIQMDSIQSTVTNATVYSYDGGATKVLALMITAKATTDCPQTAGRCGVNAFQYKMQTANKTLIQNTLRTVPSKSVPLVDSFLENTGENVSGYVLFQLPKSITERQFDLYYLMPDGRKSNVVRVSVPY